MLMLLRIFLLSIDDLATRIPRFPLPTSLKCFSKFEAREDMCFRINDNGFQGEEFVRGEEKVEVFECFGLTFENCQLLHF